jgi:RNA recognition motif-containing protein
MEANDDDGETKKGFQNSVFIKNLNFETTEKTI